MKIPFTVEQFFNVFAQYNTAIGPAQVIVYLLAAAAVTMVFMNKPFAGRLMSATLGVFWVWMGALFSVLGVARSSMSFSFVRTPVSAVGLLFVLYAIAIYPIVEER